jgi:murein peptide amidase A
MNTQRFTDRTKPSPTIMKDTPNTLIQTTRAQRETARGPYRSLDLITGPLSEASRHSSSFIACEPGRFELAGRSHELPRYLLLGPTGGAEPLRIGLFAGIHGDEPAGSFALVRLVRLLEENPEIARGFCLFLYPVCNPTGFEDNTRHNRNGQDLNREFWRNSRQPEIRLLESELWHHAFHGLISLHADNTSAGLYGYAQGPLLTQHLLRPALAAAAKFLPLNQNAVIDGFRARDGIIRDNYAGMLRSPPRVKARPFEVVLETPQQAPQYLQETALAAALCTILDEYRKFIAYAQNL